MRGRVRRFGILHDKKWLDPSGFPLTPKELLLNLATATFEYKAQAVQAARAIDKNIPADEHYRPYASVIWIDVQALRAGKHS